MLQGLLGALAFLCFAIWALKKWGPKGVANHLNGGRKIKIIERVSLGGRSSVVLLTVSGREVLIAQNSAAVAISPLVGGEMSLEEAAAALAVEGQGVSAGGAQ
jgi:flagellar biogenesis protein FliO